MSTVFMKCFVVFSWLVIAIVYSVDNKNNKCVVCKKCCKEKLSSSRNALPRRSDIERCFGISCDDPGVLCSSCRRHLYTYKATGKTAFKVSIPYFYKTL